MTNQELYTTVRNHLLTQMIQSRDDSLTCMYRGPSDLKCAIGCLIPDEKYSPHLERHLVNNKQVAVAAGLSFMTEKKIRSGYDGSVLVCGPQIELAQRLQGIHDSDDPHQWEEALRKLAGQFDLQIEGA